MNSYFIIDKEDSISNTLDKVLEDFPLLFSMGKSSLYDESMNIILKRKPDLVFLNLDNILENPFGFVTELKTYLDIVPKFVAMSSSSNFAYKAIKYSFIDYLITPVSELEVRKLLMKFKKKQRFKTNKTLCIQSYKDYRYLNIDNILFLKADNNTTDFHLTDGSIISAFKTLKVFENSLPNNFLRIHKSYIVNKNFVSRINQGKSKCTLTNTSCKLPFTKTYMDNIEFIKESLSDISISNLNYFHSL